MAYVVQRGDTIWDIAEKTLIMETKNPQPPVQDVARRMQEIIATNISKFNKPATKGKATVTPDLIYSGLELDIPGFGAPVTPGQAAENGKPPTGANNPSTGTQPQGEQAPSGTNNPSAGTQPGTGTRPYGANNPAISGQPIPGEGPERPRRPGTGFVRTPAEWIRDSPLAQVLEGRNIPNPLNYREQGGGEGLVRTPAEWVRDSPLVGAVQGRGNPLGDGGFVRTPAEWVRDSPLMRRMNPPSRGAGPVPRRPARPAPSAPTGGREPGWGGRSANPGSPWGGREPEGVNGRTNAGPKPYPGWQRS